MVYTVILIPEAEGGYSVAVPALKGCYSQGETVEEALEMVKDAISLYVAALQADGLPVPASDRVLVANVTV